ncbi:hypothetical protein SPRG_15909 [Saprolegnia parasitica CBS 223.65]|uniref:glucan endo-1,3-beta-D-glucosidase n=1 Tax=Saprolegnia parasitica (strain CBS 223.65) TaxID=695850 RepID=A0A067BPW2_SAPPC|nr:hypothetical protein SPRG_15909 [Saprolegnia parasitica CBS 223.65]KDO18810.1 hypothetical protein SPRG_15909 [Saprolegnia parasitica CBS 223.65]|eukprot:XP_012210474.1 hypothetical protein SPRG_15909 [Saprolegnia parasitica CBS 223.65]
MDSQLVTSMSEVDDFRVEKQAPRRWHRKRMLGLLGALVLVGAVIGIVAASTSSSSDAKTVSTSATNLGMAICYDTYQPDKIDAHFTTIATRFSAIRSFQTWLPNNDNVIDAAARHKLFVYPGIWLRGADYARDVQAAIDGARRHPGTVKAVLVGNEDLSNGWSVSDLISKIKDVRAKFSAAGLSHIAIGTVQIDGALLSHPEVADVCDVVGVNMYAFFSGASYSYTDPMRDTDVRWKAIYAKFGSKAVITETGWPFAGGNYGQHVASHEMAVYYFNAFRDWASKGANGGSLPAYFMFHNNPAKGGYEANFGLADESGKWKFDFAPVRPIIPSPNQPVVVPTSQYELPFLLQTSNGKVLFEMNKNIFAYDEATCANERWTYDLGTNQIFSTSSGQCLDAYFANAKFNLHVWPCDASNGNQKWTIDIKSNRVVHLTHKNLCLDADPTKADASVQVWACTGGSNQQIRLNPDLPHLGVASRETNNVLVSENDKGDASAAWTFLQSKNMLLHEASGKCLDGYEFKNGGAVHLWRCDETNANQKWIYDKASRQLTHGAHREFCLDIGSVSVGASPTLYTCHGENDPHFSYQQFTFVM